jgi:hypothetical protein
MRADLLDVIAVRANPIRWAVPDRIARDWITSMLDQGVRLTIGEVQYGERPFAFAGIPHVNHFGFRARTMCWSKENVVNLCLTRLPDAKYICWHDSDVFHEKANWASETVHALQHYTVVQPWDTALDRGPDGEVMQVHKSFCSLYHAGKPVVPEGKCWWTFQGGKYTYSHTGYCWSATRQFFDWVGGLIEICAMGSGDHAMGHGLVGAIHKTFPGKVARSYAETLELWQARAMLHVNRNIGFVPGVVNHTFHGSKEKRAYVDRWKMFIDHGFDPAHDLKRNASGVLEWAGNKPELQREFDNYLRSRQEDSNQSGAL